MNVVFAGNTHFPFGSASASRTRNLALGLRDCQANVHVISMAPKLEVHIAKERSNLSVNSYDGITYEYTAGHQLQFQRYHSNKSKNPQLNNRRLWDKLFWSIQFYSSILPTYQRIHKLILKNQCDLMISYGRNAALLAPLVRLCKRYSIPCVLDIVELSEQYSGLGGRLNPMYWDWVLGTTILPGMYNGLVVITNALRTMYMSKGCRNVLVVPSIETWNIISAPIPKPKVSGSFHLTYVGAMLPRDSPDVLLEAMRILASQDIPVTLSIIGKYENTDNGRRLADYCRQDALLRRCVNLVGSVSDDDLITRLRSSDGLILTRRNVRTEIYSFPTRLVEFLKQGRPVFVSNVGDVSHYLRDGIDAIFVDPVDPSYIAASITAVVNSSDRGAAIGFQGQRRGAECFDRRYHAQRLINFVAQIT